MSDRFKTCSQCPREMNVIDEHENCFRHRDCKEGSPCDICKDWTPERWSSIRKMVEKAIARANKPATITSPPPESRSEETRADVQVSFMGNVGTLQSQRQPQVPFTGNTRNTGAIATHTQAPLLGGPQMQMQPPMFPYGFMPGQSFNEQFFNTLIDQRIKQMMSPPPKPAETGISSERVGVVGQVRIPDATPDVLGTERGKKRFNRLEPSSLHQSDEESHISGDTLDIEADNNDFASETRSILQEKSSDHDVDSVSNFSMDEGACASVEWKNFVAKMSRELGISLEQEKTTNEFVSYVSDRLVSPKTSTKHKLPLEGSAIQSLMEVDKEWQSKGRIRSFKAHDDARYAISSEHFSQFCQTPHLDSNIEEGIMGQPNRKGAGPEKRFKFQDKQNVSRNSELRKIDLGARLLLREISYGSLVTSYLDKVVSDEDKTEALQALMQIFHSMADATSRIIIGTVGARRNLYLQDMAFKNKATEQKLLNMSTVGSEIFHGKFFDTLHSSAENLRDAKETQHLRNRRTQSSSDNQKKRKYEGNDQQDDDKPASKYPKTGDSSKKHFRSRSKSKRGQDRSAKGNDNQLGFRTPK